MCRHAIRHQSKWISRHHYQKANETEYQRACQPECDEQMKVIAPEHRQHQERKNQIKMFFHRQAPGVKRRVGSKIILYEQEIRPKSRQTFLETGECLTAFINILKER